MSVISVNSTAGLMGALKVAKGGDTITLASGTYSGVALNGVNISGGVTITSADPTHEAILAGFKIYNSSGIRLSDLDLTTVGSGDAYFGFRIGNSSNISLTGLSVHGSMDGTPLNDISGILIQGSKNVSITNSQFQQLNNAIEQGSNQNVTIYNNQFHDLRTDGIDTSGTSGVTIADNSFTNFYSNGVGGSADHPDAIQFWTTGTTASAHDISVTDNLITRGSGNVEQGIFITDQSGGQTPFQNVNIEGNTLVGTMWNGIMVTGASNISVTNNQVTGFADMDSRIRIEQVSSGVVSNNQATAYVWNGNGALTEQSDTLLKDVTDGGKSLVQQYLNSHPGAVSSLSQALLNLVGSSTVTSATASSTTAAQATSGAASGEMYTFHPGSGHDVVADFGAFGSQDVLNLSAYYKAGLTPTLAASSVGTVVSFSDGDTITLVGVQPTQLHSFSTGYFV